MTILSPRFTSWALRPAEQLILWIKSSGKIIRVLHVQDCDAAATLRNLGPKPPAPPPTSIGVRAVMQGNRGHDTSPERAIRSAIHARGLRFRKQVSPLPGLRCRADFIFPKERVAVFVDGCFWHGCPIHGRRPTRNSEYWQDKFARNRARDERNNVVLAENGWAVIRAWEHEPVDKVAARVQAEVLRRRGNT